MPTAKLYDCVDCGELASGDDCLYFGIPFCGICWDRVLFGAKGRPE